MNFKKGFLYVFMATGIGFVINLVTGFVLPKFLSIETYADIKMYQLYITYVGILHLGFSDGMYLNYGGKNIEELDKYELVSEFKTFKLFQLIVNIFAIIISFIIGDKVIILVSASILPINIANYLRNLYQATGLYNLYSRFTSMNNIMIFVINMVLLFIVKTDNSMNYIICYVIAYFIYWLIIELTIKSKIFNSVKGKYNFKYFVKDIKDGILLMLGNFCSVIFTSIDRLLVKYFLGTAKFAYYSFAVSIEGLLNVFITPISVTMYNYFCINKEKEKITQAKRLIIVFSGFLIMSTYPVKFIVNNFIDKYNESVSIVFYLFAAQFFSIIVKCVFNNLYKANKKQTRYFKIMVFIIILSAVLNLIFYKIKNSINSFALATLLTCFIWFLIGESDFKEYRYAIKEYIYMLSLIIIYLITGNLLNSIVGFIIYLIAYLVLTCILMSKEVKYGLNNVEVIKNKFLKKRS